MSKLSDLLRAESEHAEEHRDAPITAETTVTRPGGRAKVYSLRLSEEEFTALEAAAKRAGVPASALARTWITERLSGDADKADLRALAQTLEDVARRLAVL